MSANEHSVKHNAPKLHLAQQLVEKIIDAFTPRVTLLLIALTLALKLPLTGSLWLDEGITAWITRGTLPQSINLAIAFQGQSPLYFILEWGAQLIFGSSELALRLISLFGVAGAALILIQLGKDLVNKNFGYLAAAIFLTLDPVQVAAVSARPYGLALFFAVASFWALKRWHIKVGILNSTIYLLTVLFTVYLQYLFATILVIHFIYIICNFSARKPTFTAYAFKLLTLFAALTPALLHVMDLEGRSSQLQFIPAPTYLALLTALFPPALVISTLGAVILAAIFGDKRERAWSVSKSTAIWIASWIILPPLALSILSSYAGLSLFIDRYFLIYTPALALTAAAVPYFWKDNKTRHYCIIALSFLILIREVDRKWQVEDWRGVAQELQAISPEVPVLLYSGLIESKDLAWLVDHSKQQYLSAPLLYYGVNRGIIPLPPSVDSQNAEEYLDGIVGNVLGSFNEVPLVILEQKYNKISTTLGWRNLFEHKGFKSREVAPNKLSRVKILFLSKKSQTKG